MKTTNISRKLTIHISILLYFALLLSCGASRSESFVPSKDLVFPDANGVYAFDGSTFTPLYSGIFGRTPEERKLHQSFSKNLGILIFQKWLLSADAKFSSIKIRDWRSIDETPRPEIAVTRKPVEDHPGMIMLVPQQPLSPSLYSVTIDDKPAEYGFGVQAPGEEQFWNIVLNERPNSWQAHNHLGAVLYMRGDWKEAYPHFLKAVELNPNNPECHNNLGLALSMQGKNDEAIQQYEMAVKIKDDSAMETNLANVYEQVKRYDDAIKAYQHALTLNPKNPSAHCNLGWALMQQGKIDEAIIEFQKTIELDPDMPMAKSDLQKALEMKNSQDPLRPGL
jgi:hypothetical protein